MNIIKPFFTNRVTKYALPFFIFMIGGSFFLSEFTAVRYKYDKKVEFFSKEEAEKLGVEYEPNRGAIEEEYKKMQERDLNKWENKRVPRPWEETDDQ